MKIAFLGIDTNFDSQEKIIKYLQLNILKLGERASLISYFNNSYDSIKNIIDDKYDIVFCIGSNTAIYNYNIKENLSKIFNKKLENNNSCELALKQYCESNSVVFGSQEELHSFIPVDSIPLFNDKYYHNGFMYKHINSLIVFLPSDIEFVKSTFTSLVLPCINELITSNSESVILRCYGILEKDIRTLIHDEINDNLVNIQIIGELLDNIIYIRYNNSNSIQPIVAEICSKLSKFIYSTEDTNLYETAINLLKIQKKKVIIAETLTYGNIAFNLSKLDNNVINNSLIFNNFDTMIKNMKLNDNIINQFGKYSVNTIYELDNLLLQSSDADIAVFLLGDKSIDTCYIAIGDIDGIHVYKNKILSFDDNLISSLSNTTLFYLIKKLRQNDLQFR